MICDFYERHHHEDPAFPFYFHRNFQTTPHPANAPKVLHWHESLELLYILTGCCDVICGGRSIEAHEGELIVVNSGVLHAVLGRDSPAVYHCLIIDSAFTTGLQLDLSGIWFAERLRSREAGASMKAIAEEVAGAQPLYKLAVQAEAARLLIWLFRHAQAERPDEAAGGNERLLPTVKAAMAYIRLHLAEPLSTAGIAAYLGFSPYYLCHLFREMTGMTMTDYINGLRCDYASQLLSSGAYSVTECAERSGFSTMSYFAKTFRRYQGCAPSALLDQRQKGTV